MKLRRPRPVFLEKLEAELADEKPKKKEEIIQPKQEVADEKEDKDKIKKKKKKKKQLESMSSGEIKEEPKNESKMPKMPALAKMSKAEAAAAEAKRSGDNIFEKMDGMKEEQMPVLESENISSDDVDKLDDYGDPPSDLQIETQRSVDKEDDDKKEVEKVPVLTEEQRREQLEKAVAGIMDENTVNQPPKREPVVPTPVTVSEVHETKEPILEPKIEKQEEIAEESKEHRVEEDLEAAARLAAMLEGSFDNDPGIPVEEPDVPVVVEEQQEEVITDNTPPGMQDEAAMALQALKASASSESEDNETPSVRGDTFARALGIHANNS